MNVDLIWLVSLISGARAILRPDAHPLPRLELSSQSSPSSILILDSLTFSRLPSDTGVSIQTPCGALHHVCPMSRLDEACNGAPTTRIGFRVAAPITEIRCKEAQPSTYDIHTFS